MKKHKKITRPKNSNKRIYTKKALLKAAYNVAFQKAVLHMSKKQKLIVYNGSGMITTNPCNEITLTFSDSDNILYGSIDVAPHNSRIDRILKMQRFEDRKSYLSEIKKYTGHKIIFGDLYNEAG